MSLAANIREYVNTHYFEPARRQGLNQITVTSGRIHKEMRLSSSMPLVCSTLRGRQIEAYGVTLVKEIRPPTVKFNSSTNQFVFEIKSNISQQDPKPIQDFSSTIPSIDTSDRTLDSSQFEERCRSHLSKLFNTQLSRVAIPGVPKIFDFVSPDNKIIGDAKFYSMVRGEGNPSAKLSTISEYVWLLEKIPATYKFLVFGNDIRVPETWLEKNGDLVKDVDFLFYDPKIDTVSKIIMNSSNPIHLGSKDFNLEVQEKPSRKYGSGSKYDIILDKFRSDKWNLVKVEVKGKDAEYVCERLQERIDARDLNVEIEAAVVDGITYLEKKDYKQFLEEKLCNIMKPDFISTLLIFYHDEKVISPSSAVEGYICAFLYYIYFDEFEEGRFKDAHSLIFWEFIREKMPSIKIKIEEVENDPKVKKVISRIGLENRIFEDLKILTEMLKKNTDKLNKRE